MVQYAHVKKIVHFLNPLARLGQRNYSFFFPFLVVFGTCIFLEFYAFAIAHNPDVVNSVAIFLFVFYILYFSLRDGVKGGFTAVILTILYYLYIIATRDRTAEQFRASITTTIVLSGLYALLAWIIGWLRQRIDTLIESEANEKTRLQSILDQLPVGIVVANPDGTITHANKQLMAILGTKIPIGHNVYTKPLVQSTYNKKTATQNDSPLVHVLKTGNPVIRKEFTIHTQTGKKKYVLISSSAIHNAQNKIIAGASIVSDITQHKILEERKDDFVNMASHELKTPITSIKIYLNSLQKQLNENGDPKSLSLVNRLHDQTQRLQKLVNDLLDVSRLQTGVLTIAKDEVKLHELVKEVVDILRTSTKHENIKIAKNDQILIYADKLRLYQVLTNVLSNAIKYTPESGKIVVSLKKNGKNALVTIKDSGIGIAKEEHRKIFQRLYRVGEEKERTFPGFGMGLYIVQEIIKKHRGKIWVESEKGKGTTFSISLPLTAKN